MTKAHAHARLVLPSGYRGGTYTNSQRLAILLRFSSFFSSQSLNISIREDSILLLNESEPVFSNCINIWIHQYQFIDFFHDKVN